ncbi:MAG: GAF domain-containing protein, partial [Actinomycetota bacterium]|nr:GAF domain-containing protein [Actinomycetota bacterium]
HGALLFLALAGTGLYGVAAVRYLIVYRQRPSLVLLSVVTAFALLAEAMVAVGFARNWHTSWWEWHLLMTAAFGFVAYSATAQRRREGSAGGLFNSITMQETIRAVRQEYGDALEALVGAIGRQQDTGRREPIAVLAAQVGTRFAMTERQVEVLERAAEALVTEREQVQHLGALVAVGEEASVIRQEPDLVDRAVALIQAAFTRDDVRVGLLDQGQLRFVPDDASSSGPTETAMRRLEVVESPAGSRGTHLVLPLAVKGHAAGVVEVHRRDGGFAEQDRFVLQSLANQLSIAVENVRLYRQIDGLFRQYMSPDVVTALLADPGQASLGGSVAEVTVLMADLRGFTPFSEQSAPKQVVAMLNRYFGLAVPIILGEGGTVVQFVGDAVMALFNAPARQPDHALRAARAGLAMQDAIEAVAAGRPDWPRFRIGINTGPALVGNIGSDQFRNFTAIGDTTNLAARLETSAEVGQVIIGPTTYAHIRHVATVDPLGPLQLKGKELPVEAFALRRLA